MFDRPLAFEHFEREIRNLPDVPGRDDLLSDRFLLRAEDNLAIYYAPFDQVNARAKLVLVGVTPGWTQMQLAYRTAAERLRAGDDATNAMAAAKQAASFAGAMRSHLASMLDDLQIPQRLGAVSAVDLFGDAADLLHSTSAIVYPTFVDGLNFTGHRPRLTAHPLLVSIIDEVLAPEIETVPDALVVPLGHSVELALERLVADGRLDAGRCLMGFPHPSGANGHRVRQFSERRSALRRRVGQWLR